MKWYKFRSCACKSGKSFAVELRWHTEHCEFRDDQLLDCVVWYNSCIQCHVLTKKKLDFATAIQIPATTTNTLYPRTATPTPTQYPVWCQTKGNPAMAAQGNIPPKNSRARTWTVTNAAKRLHTSATVRRNKPSHAQLTADENDIQHTMPQGQTSPCPQKAMTPHTTTRCFITLGMAQSLSWCHRC